MKSGSEEAPHWILPALKAFHPQPLFTEQASYLADTLSLSLYLHSYLWAIYFQRDISLISSLSPCRHVVFVFVIVFIFVFVFFRTRICVFLIIFVHFLYYCLFFPYLYFVIVLFCIGICIYCICVFLCICGLFIPRTTFPYWAASHLAGSAADVIQSKSHSIWSFNTS